MELNIYQVDAFTNELFHGNPAAVIPLKAWLPEETMQKIGAENNLSETAFFVPYEGHFYIRWFTPTVEVDLCGHATLASAHVLFRHLNFAAPEIRFFSKSGWLRVKRSGDKYVLDFPADIIKPVDVPANLQKGLKTQILEVYVGRDDYLVILETQEKVEALLPDFSLLKKLNSRGIIVSAPGKTVDFVSRGFFPSAGIDEDPVTGSAHTTLTPYWSKKLDKKALTARQVSQRGGDIWCTYLGDRVEIAGNAVTYMEGIIQY